MKSKPYEDFLQTMLESTYEDGTVPSEEDIRAEVDTFMVLIEISCLERTLSDLHSSRDTTQLLLAELSSLVQLGLLSHA